jgi:hypothetical protein
MQKCLWMIFVCMCVSRAKSFEALLRSVSGASEGTGTHDTVRRAGAVPAAYPMFRERTRPAIRLIAGLTVVTAVNQSGKDYESIKTVNSVSGGEVSIAYSAEGKEIGHYSVHRTVRAQDLQLAHSYRSSFPTDGPMQYPGTTSLT